MRKTIYKWFWAWNFDKEEKWLNEMSAKGQQLCEVGYCRYVFEEGALDEYAYRLEFLEKAPRHEESVRYLQFMEDTGVEYIGSIFRWVYLRRRSDGHGFDLYSDIGSRIRHLNRILLLMGILSGVNLLNGTNQMIAWASLGYTYNLITGILVLSVGLLIGLGFLRLALKKRKLQKEQILRE